MMQLLADHPEQRVWGYVRWSETGPPSNPLSPESQRADILACCAAAGVEEPLILEERASASRPMFLADLPGRKSADDAKETVPRPLFLALLAHFRTLNGGTLVISRVNRLSTIIWEQEVLIRMCQEYRIRILCKENTEPHLFDGGQVTDPGRMFFRTIAAVMTSYETGVEELQHKHGLFYKAVQHKYTGGAPTFGYVVIKGELVPDPYQSRMIRYVFYLRRRHKLSQRAIGEHINRHKSPEDETHYDRQRIMRILNAEPLYRGRYRDTFKTIHDRPDLRILPDNDQELFNEWDPQQRTGAGSGIPSQTGGGSD